MLLMRLLRAETRRAWRGARLLDRERPGWALDVDTNILWMSDGNRCILGQLYGGYGRGLHQLDLAGVEGRAVVFGFTQPPKAKGLYYPNLTLAWKGEIERRRGEWTPLAA